jgi:hypothetical protein
MPEEQEEREQEERDRTLDGILDRADGKFTRWFNRLRVISLFLLGMVMIIYAVVEPTYNIPYLIGGLVLVGMVPIEQWVEKVSGRWSLHHHHDEDEEEDKKP